MAIFADLGLRILSILSCFKNKTQEEKIMKMNRRKIIVLNDYDLPVIEILTRLPVKSLMRFKLVCKHWNNVIKDEYFRDLHLTHSKNNPIVLLHTADWSISGTLKTFTLSSMDLRDCAATNHVPKLTLPLLTYITSKPVNGLLCVSHELGVHVYNLSTREKQKLGSIAERGKEGSFLEKAAMYGSAVVEAYGFGFDPITKVHKAIRIWEFATFRSGVAYSKRFCEVFTIGKDKSWRIIDAILPQNQFNSRPFIYANGSISRLHDDFKFIASFDVGSEKFRLISIPDCIKDKPLLLEVDGCLACVNKIEGAFQSKNTIQMWILHEDLHDKKDNSSNWTEETIHFDWDKDMERLLVQAISGTHWIIIRFRNKVSVFGDEIKYVYYLYDRKKKTSKKLKTDYKACLMTTFAESLYNCK